MQKSLYQKFPQLRKLRRKWHKHRRGRQGAKRIRWQNLTTAAIVVANLFLSLNLNTTPVSANGCKDVEFIFARGSGEPVVTEDNPNGGASFQQWKYWLEDALYYTTGLSFSFYDLGQSSAGGHQYPAVPVTDSFGGVINLIGAAISAGDGFAFGESVDEGVEELKAHIAEKSQACPDQKFVLGGFSQGAMVVSKSLSQLDPEKIIYAATFGDPKIYLPEGDSHAGIFSKIPDACKGLNFSNYRVYVPDCYAYEGALGSYRPYQPEGYWDKLGTWCNGSDIMCSSGWSISDHIDYVNGHFYEQASRVIRDRIEATFAEPNIVAPPTPSSPLSNHDVIFLFDASGSMKSLVDIYKTQAKELIQKVISAGGRTGLFAYREFQEHVWPNMRCALGCSEEEMEYWMDRIIFRGGGDGDEGLLSAINAVFDRTDWADGATKSIVVLTDAGFHDPDRDGSDLASIVQRSLEIDPVNIYVISDGKEDDYTELVSLTSGAYFDVHTEAALSTERISERPVAKLNQDGFFGVIGDTLEFDASASSSNFGEELTYDWDLDGDGVFELTNQPAKVSQTFYSEFDDFIQVKVTDSHGVNTMSAKVRISRNPEPLTQITNLQTQDSQEDRGLAQSSQKITFNTDGAKVFVALEDAPIGFVIPEDEAGNFTVEDVTKPTRVTLIPYSESGSRGEKVEITLQPNGDNPTPEVPTKPDDDLNSGDDLNPDDNSTAGDKTSPTTPRPSDDIIAGSISQPNNSSENLPSPVVIVPHDQNISRPVFRAPNTGTCE